MLKAAEQCVVVLSRKESMLVMVQRNLLTRQCSNVFKLFSMVMVTHELSAFTNVEIVIFVN